MWKILFLIFLALGGVSYLLRRLFYERGLEEFKDELANINGVGVAYLLFSKANVTTWRITEGKVTQILWKKQELQLKKELGQSRRIVDLATVLIEVGLIIAIKETPKALQLRAQAIKFGLLAPPFVLLLAVFGVAAGRLPVNGALGVFLGVLLLANVLGAIVAWAEFQGTLLITKLLNTPSEKEALSIADVPKITRATRLLSFRRLLPACFEFLSKK